MASWFGKYDFQGNVNNNGNNGFGTSSDNTNKKRNCTMYCNVRNKVALGVWNNNTNSNVNLDANDNLESAVNNTTLMQLNKGQFCYFQDVSDNANFFSTFTQTLNPDPCIPQVVDLSNIDFTNIDISNAYDGVILWNDETNTQLDTSMGEIYRYAEISNNNVDSGAGTYDFSGTRLELVLKKNIFSYPGTVFFGAPDC